MDLSDELGNVKNLLEHGRKYANDVLKPRGTFVLIKVESKLIHNYKLIMSRRSVKYRSHLTSQIFECVFNNSHFPMIEWGRAQRGKFVVECRDSMHNDVMDMARGSRLRGRAKSGG